MAGLGVVVFEPGGGVAEFHPGGFGAVVDTAVLVHPAIQGGAGGLDAAFAFPSIDCVGFFGGVGSMEADFCGGLVKAVGIVK